MKLKRIMIIVVCLILSIVMFLLSTAFITRTEKFVLRVGYLPGYGMDVDANGNFFGYTYDYMKDIANINHWDVEFIPCDWSEGIELLKQGKLDLFGPMEKTHEREAIYDYPANSMGEEYAALYVSDDDDSIFYNSAESLNGKKIGMISGNYFFYSLKEYCEQNQISVEYVVLDSPEGMAAALLDGSVDIQLAGSLKTPSNSRLVLSLGSEDFFYPTTKDNRLVLDGINRALLILHEENIFYNAKLYEKHYAQILSQKKEFTFEEAEFIKNAPVLYVGYEATNQPVEYYDKKSRMAKGISIDLMEKVSEYSGLKFEFVPTYSMEHMREMMQNHEIQLVSGLVFCNDFEEFYKLKPSEPLLENTLVFIAKHGTDFNTDKINLAIPEKWEGIRHHISRTYPEFSIKTYPNIEDCLDAVENGKVKLTVMTSHATGKKLKASRYADLVANSMKYGYINICLGTDLDESPVLHDIINKSIASIDANVRNQIVYKHTISVPYEPSFDEILRYNLPLIFMGIVFFLFAWHLFSTRSRKKLNKLAYYDQLTGEMNLNKFKLETQKLMLHKDKKYALMVFDIDKFKSINDLYGYDFGDNVLLIVTKSLKKFLLPNTIFCRGIADKFYMFFEFKGNDWLNEQFKLVVQYVNEEIERNLPNCHIALSSGICLIDSKDNNIDSIIDRANIASKQVKNYHESRFAFYDKSMYDKLNQIRTIENDMLESLKREEFLVYLQPKIKLSTKCIEGAEALVRWQHPENGVILPSDFIPLFEENGFIVNLDFYMLEQVCKLLERWKQEGRKLFTISINLSRRHLFHTDTVWCLNNIVSKYDVDPTLIEVELTESAFDNCDVPSINILFDELHKCGFSVSVDDFGAGYSSLSLLKDLPIDVLKIDKSFFDYQSDSKTDKIDILLESVISLSRKLGIKTVSEGVETKKQVNLLDLLGCDLVQGFYFARPMPISQLEIILESSDLFDGTV